MPCKIVIQVHKAIASFCAASSSLLLKTGSLSNNIKHSGCAANDRLIRAAACYKHNPRTSDACGVSLVRGGERRALWEPPHPFLNKTPVFKRLPTVTVCFLTPTQTSAVAVHRDWSFLSLHYPTGVGMQSIKDRTMAQECSPLGHHTLFS